MNSPLMSDFHSPFSAQTSDCIRTLSETQLIEAIRQWLGPVCPASPGGIGDDCAVTDTRGEARYLLTTVDGVAWGEHFDGRVTPELAGRKLMARNLSDIASMGGVPRRAVVSLWMASSVRLDWLRRFYGGMAALAAEFEVEIIGGDIARAPDGVFIADLCMQGMSDRPIQRKQVQPGDSIWVTGSLGGSILGKHAAFTPRVREGKWLSELQWAKSMMDISDGLAKDLPSLVGSHAVELYTLPVSEAAQQCALSSGKDAWEHALCDGEDYELVFAVAEGVDTEQMKSLWKQAFEGVSLTCIGRVFASADGYSLLLDRPGQAKEVFDKKGYEHF